MHPAHKAYGPTQKEIADALELAQSTVATALNPDTAHKLQPETAARIQAYAQKVGYRPQRFAQIMRGGRSHIIGAVFISGKYHAPQERVKLLAQHALEGGFNLIAVDLDWFGHDHHFARHYLLDAAVEGVVLCNLMEDRIRGWLNFCRDRALPVVTMGQVPEHEAFDSVQSDLRSAFGEMTRHHIAQGSRFIQHVPHMFARRIADLPDSNKSVRDRLLGFADAIIAAGGQIQCVPEDLALLTQGKASSAGDPDAGLVGGIFYPQVTETQFRDAFEFGRLAMLQVLDTQNTLPDSLLFSNDDSAVGALSVCIERGIRVPAEIRLSGVDDAPFARYCGVPLTTVRQPSEAMAGWAVKRIIELIEKPAARRRAQNKKMPCTIVPRCSTTGEYAEYGAAAAPVMEAAET